MTTLTEPCQRTRIELPIKAQFLFRPKRYKVLKGGRGATKSWDIARALISLASQKKLLVVCVRETQASITESVHRLLTNQIESLGLSDVYDIGQKVIRCPRKGSEFIFFGIRTDPGKIKSLEGADICWVSEAAKISENSWKILIPTIRKDASEIWIDFNPDEETDPTSQRFLFHPPPDCEVVEMNWQDNPWFPETLRKEKDYDYKVDPESAAHVWGGQFRKGSQAQIFGPTLAPDGTRKPKYIVEAFEAEEKNKGGELQPKVGWKGPYFGADWGFSPDPVTLVKLWVCQPRLYIECEAYGVGVELNEIPTMFSSIPGSSDHVIRADNSRPELISYISLCCSNCGVHSELHGGRACKKFKPFNIVAADKWPGSIEDGIAYMRHFELIVIHPRCTHHAEEFRLYRKKIDPITGDVLPIIIDKHNHCIDGDRYAMQPAISTPEEELTVVYEEPETSFNPEMDEFDLRNGI